MKTKILLVDDKDEFRRLVKIYLSRNFNVEMAQNGSEAIDMLNSGYTPDIIVSDLMMPECDGKSLVTRMRKTERLKKIPCIILSSIDKSTKKIELLQSGANDYMIKPFNPHELEMRIQKLLTN